MVIHEQQASVPLAMAYYPDMAMPQFDGSVMSIEEHMELPSMNFSMDPAMDTLMGPSMASMSAFPTPNLNDMTAFDNQTNHMGAHLEEMHLFSPNITPVPVNEPTEMLDSSVQDVNSLVSNVNAPPWTPQHSQPVDFNNSLRVPGQSKSQFMQSMSVPTHLGASCLDYWRTDSAYASGIPPYQESVSCFSGPTAAPSLYSQEDNVSDVFDTRPKKKQKKTFVCDHPSDHKTREFVNIHDFERHQRSAHGIQPTHSRAFHYQCQFKDCRSKNKLWDRKDNFKSHILRKHYPGRDATYNSQRTLTKVETQAMFEEKEKQKAASREMAKRKARKSSARLHAAEAKSVKSEIAPAPAETPAAAGASDDGECLFSPGDISHRTSPMDGSMSTYNDTDMGYPLFPTNDHGSPHGADDLW